MTKPLVLVDVPLLPFLERQIDAFCTICPWLNSETPSELLSKIEGIYTYGHPKISAELMDRSRTPSASGRLVAVTDCILYTVKSFTFLSINPASATLA